MKQLRTGLPTPPLNHIDSVVVDVSVFCPAPLLEWDLDTPRLINLI